MTTITKTGHGRKSDKKRAIAERELPRIPNAETQEAMNDVLSGRTEPVSLAELKKRFLGDE